MSHTAKGEYKDIHLWWCYLELSKPVIVFWGLNYGFCIAGIGSSIYVHRRETNFLKDILQNCINSGLQHA